MSDYPKDELAKRRLAAAINRLAVQVGEYGAQPDHVDGLPSWADALNSIVDRSVYVPPHLWMDLCAAMSAIRHFVFFTPDAPEGVKELLVRFDREAMEILRL